MNDVFSLANCFALAGGFLGALVVSDFQRYGAVLTLAFFIIGMVFAAALTNYFLKEGNPWLVAGVGVFAGMSSTSLLDAFKATTPKLASQLIDFVCSTADRFLNRK
ncbi:hypothetical protein [Snodgrassella alvi]|uniref:hypothetical protein n=1 Tax=Snodgrassella alvi TaxID=1196083 RepID=UPI0027403BD0|nr:hypothetical protein [Snodgrassella alvi]WLT02903.1 hypothetical protein RAM00_03530 [Snodgrassella alvi]